MNQNHVQLASVILPAAAPFVRATITERMQLKTMEKQKEMNLELIEAKNNADQQFAANPAPAPQPRESSDADVVVSKPVDEFAESIDNLIADEECSMCCKLLEGIKDVPPKDRAVALSEYGRFKQSVENTPDADAVREEIGDMTVLKTVMTREFNMAPS